MRKLLVSGSLLVLLAGLAVAQVDDLLKTAVWDIQQGKNSRNQIRTLRVSGNGTVGGTLAVTGNTTIGGTLTVTGAFTPTGSIYAPNGTTALPGIASSSDHSRGLSFATTNAIAVSIAGSEKMRVNATGVGIGTNAPSDTLHVEGGNIRLANGVLEVANGTTAAPAIAPTANMVKGFSFAATNAIAASIAGTEVLTINGTGIGINTNSPVYALDVHGSAHIHDVLYNADGSASAPSYTFTSDTNSGLFWPGADVLGLVVGGVEKLNIAAGMTYLNTDVSIGTNAAGATDHYVEGTMAIPDGITVGLNAVPTTGAELDVQGDTLVSTTLTVGTNAVGASALTVEGATVMDALTAVGQTYLFGAASLGTNTVGATTHYVEGNISLSDGASIGANEAPAGSLYVAASETINTNVLESGIELQVEGDTMTDKLLVGTNAPSANTVLQVEGGFAVYGGMIRIQNDKEVRMYDSNGVDRTVLHMGTGSQVSLCNSSTNGGIAVKTGDGSLTTRILVDSAGLTAVGTNTTTAGMELTVEGNTMVDVLSAGTNATAKTINLEGTAHWGGLPTSTNGLVAGDLYFADCTAGGVTGKVITAFGL